MKTLTEIETEISPKNYNRNWNEAIPVNLNWNWNWNKSKTLITLHYSVLPGIIITERDTQRQYVSQSEIVFSDTSRAMYVTIYFLDYTIIRALSR